MLHRSNVNFSYKNKNQQNNKRIYFVFLQIFNDNPLQSYETKTNYDRYSCYMFFLFLRWLEYDRTYSGLPAYN
jgi:hypothetical protein